MHGQKIVVTGTSSGLGLELARHLCQRGHTVYGCSRSCSTIQSSNYHHIVIDLTCRADVTRWTRLLQEKAGTINALVNNAGILGKRDAFLSIDFEVWRSAIDTNVLAVIQVTRELLPLLIANPGGAKVINISSVIGRFARAGWSPYAVTKAALESLTQCLAQEHAKDNIHFVAVHPSRYPTKLRRLAYPQEPEANSKNLTDFCAAVAELIEDHLPLTFSGQTLATADLPIWRIK